jgi:hypothetical protein
VTPHAPCHLYDPADRTAGARSTFCAPGLHEPVCIMCGLEHPCPDADADGLLRQEIAGPGIYDGMDIDFYHGDPTPLADGGSLSHSGAVQLLPPKTPAHYRHWRDHEQGNKRVWDLGHVMHSAILGDGPTMRVVKADSWRTNAAKEEAVTARLLGEVPVLEKDADRIPDMVDMVRNHPKAGPLLDPDRGTAERSFFWRHPRTGKWCRTRPDYCPNPGGRRFVLVDYKSVNKADEQSFGKAVSDFGYHIQHAMACSAVRHLGLHPNPEMVFVVQEREPPHLIAVHILPYTAIVLGERKFDQAVTLFDQCVTAQQWPGYGGIRNEPLLTELPRWATYGEEDLP